MGKVTTSVYLDSNLLEQIAEKTDMNVSTAVNVALEMFLRYEMDDTLLHFKLDRIEQEHNLLQIEKQQIENRITNLIKYKETVQKEYDDIKKRDRELVLVRLLNNQLITYDYNEFDIIENYTDLLNEMKEVNPEFNLTKYITRMKKIISQ
jgi:hypothetical protein